MTIEIEKLHGILWNNTLLYILTSKDQDELVEQGLDHLRRWRDDIASQAYKKGYIDGAGPTEEYSDDAHELIQLVQSIKLGDYINPVRNWLEQYDKREKKA